MTIMTNLVNAQEETNKYFSTVSATKMNVLYIGVENPINIIAAGVTDEKMQVSASGCGATITKKGPYNYIVNVTSPGKVSIMVSAEVNGKMTSFGQHEFRTKRIPDPVPTVAGMKGGVISKSQLLEASEVSTMLENFDFDMTFVVVGFSMESTVNGFTEIKTTTSAKFSETMIDLIKRIKSGDPLYISEVSVKCPDGVVRNIGTIKFVLQ